LPNGHPEKRERIRAASRIWSSVWEVGDFVYYLGFLACLFAPTGMTVVGLRRDASFVDSLLRGGKILLVCVLAIPVCMLAGMGLKSLCWRMAGLNDK
jgi:hypothetical protein